MIRGRKRDYSLGKHIGQEDTEYSETCFTAEINARDIIEFDRAIRAV